MSNSKSSRREAGVIDAGDPTDDQRDALKRISRYVNEIARDEPQPAPEDQWSRVVPQVDTHRRSHVFLIDGARGSGKTAVMLTLLHLWEKCLRDGQLPEDYVTSGIEPPPPEHDIVPVGLVDLQPLDPSTNLLVHLVGKLKGLVDMLDEKLTGGGAAPPTLWEAPNEIASKGKWREFLRTAVAAWESGFEHRKKNLGPDELAMEIAEREERRMGLFGTFRGFVDALVADYCRWRGKRDERSPVFVIFIDDADLNPGRSRDLLDLVRTLWHPRVVFILTGYTQLFLDVIDAGLRKDMPGSPAERRVPAGRLAGDIYDKVIPRRQRLELPPLSGAERIDILERELGHDSKSESWRAKLLDLLRSEESLAEAIPGRLRHIIDLAQLANDTDGSMPQMLYLLLQQLADEEGGGSRTRYQLASGGKTLTLDVRSRRLQVVWRDRETIGDDHRRSLDLVTNAGLFTEGRGPDDELVRRLSERDDALLLLAVQAQGAGENIKVQAGAIARGAWVHCRTSKTVVHWLLPEWQDFGTHWRATERWRRVVKERLHGTEAASWLGAAYLACLLQAGSKEDDEQIAEAGRTMAWDDLARRVAQLIDLEGRSPLGAWAAEQAVLLAAPESGLPAKAANEWLRAFRSATDEANIDWSLIAEKASSARIQRWSAGGGTGRIEERLDAEYPDYELGDMLAPRELLQSLHQELERMQWKAPSGMQLQGGRWTLETFMSERRKRMLGQAPRSVQKEMVKVLRKYKMQGLAIYAFKDMYQLLAARYPSYVKRDAIRLENRQIIPDLYTSEPTPTDVLTYPLSDGRTLRIAPVAQPMLGCLAADAPPELDAAARIAIDQVVDEEDDDHTERAVGLTSMPAWKEHREWVFLVVKDTDGSTQRLPVPAWPALIDWEKMFESWNESISTLVSLGLPSHGASGDRIYRGILCWYLGQVIQIYTNRYAYPMQNVDVTSADWSKLWVSVSNYIDGVREYKKWIQQEIADLHAQVVGSDEEAELYGLRAAALEEDPLSSLPRRQRAFFQWIDAIDTLFSPFSNKNDWLPADATDVSRKAFVNRVAEGQQQRNKPTP